MTGSAFSPERLTLDALRAAGMPKLFERDPQAWRTWLLAEFERRANRTLYPDQTEHLLVETAAYAMSLMAEAMQTAATANFTVHNEGQHLDDKAAEVGIFRLLAQRARCSVMATVPEVAPQDIRIPAGTQLFGGGVAFGLVSELVIERNTTFARGEAIALEPGTASNGFAADALTASLNSIAPGLRLFNDDVSAGGTERESDERLRQSAVDGPEAFGRRGHWAGYGLAVRRVSPDIVDVAIDRPSPGRIDLVIETAGGVVTQQLLDQILAATDPETDAPHGDQRTARGREVQVFDVHLIVRRQPHSLDVATDEAIRTAVEGALATMRRPLQSGSSRTKFAFETGPLGAQFAPSAITTAVGVLEGIIDVEAPDLAFVDLTFDTVARLGVLTIDYVDATDA